MADPNDSDVAAETIVSAVEDAPELDRGAMVGRYLVVSRLGAGAMGVVYTAFDPELSRRVALKVLRVRSGDAGAGHRIRLQREAQAMARLSHRNTVAVYDVGIAGEALFLAMELVRGTNLREWLIARPRTLAEVVSVFLEAAQGLWAAHRHALVHRDFKPENVLVGHTPNDHPTGEGIGRVCVGDFGLAAPAPSSELADGVAAPSGLFALALTHAGDLVGTPSYMAPEQLADTDTDARADQYAWCIALFEAVYGERPFVGSSPSEIRERKLVGIGTLASHGRAPLRWRVPLWLRAILRRGLAPDREQRFATMGDLIAAFERGRARPRRLAWLASAGLLATVVTVATVREQTRVPCPTPTPEGWQEFDAERITSVFAAAVPSHGGALAPWVASSITEVRERWRETHAEVCAATWVRGEQSAERLDVRMACLRRAWDRIAATSEIVQHADADVVDHAIEIVADLPTPERCREEAASGTAREAGDAAQLQTMRLVEQALARAHARRRLDRDGEAAAELDRALPLVRELGDPGLWIETLLLRGRMADDRGDLPGAIAALHEAAVRAKSIDAPLLEAEAWIALANAVGYTAHDFDEGRFYGGLALAAIDHGGGGEQLRAWAETALGTIEFVAGDDVRARALWQSALDRRRAILPASHHLVAASLNNLGGVAYAIGDHATAGTLLEQAMQMRETLFGANHPSVAESGINLALVRVDQGRGEEAAMLAERALVIQQRANGDTHPNVGRAHDALAGALESLGRHALALAHAEQAIAIYTATWGADHPAGHAVTLHRARALVGLGRDTEGRGVLEALRRRLATEGDPELRTAVERELATIR